MQVLPRQSYLYYREILVENIIRETDFIHASIRDLEETLYDIISKNREKESYDIKHDEELNSLGR